MAWHKLLDRSVKCFFDVWMRNWSFQASRRDEKRLQRGVDDLLLDLKFGEAFQKKVWTLQSSLSCAKTRQIRLRQRSWRLFPLQAAIPLKSGAARWSLHDSSPKTWRSRLSEASSHQRKWCFCPTREKPSIGRRHSFFKHNPLPPRCTRTGPSSFLLFLSSSRDGTTSRKNTWALHLFERAPPHRR